MNSFILSILCIFGKNILFFVINHIENINLALVSITNGINCVSCVGWNNPGCNDPYDETTSGDIPVPGNIYCLVSTDLYVLFFKVNILFFAFD